MRIRISQDLEPSVSFPELTCTNPLVVNYFDSLSDSQRMAAYEKALAIGVMALRDDRIAAFLAKTENELGTNLEFLKHLFERNQLRMTSAPVKGESGELAVANAVASFVEARKLSDAIQVVGRTTGALPRNKTGDILCTIGEGDDAPQIVIEVKFDKSIRLGDPSNDGMTLGKSDTAWSQLLEARANRGADVAIMVFSTDNVDRTIGAFTDSVRFVDGIGYIVIVDMMANNWTALSIAYELARNQALASRRSGVDKEVLEALAKRLCADLTGAMEVKGFIETAVANCNAAMSQIERSLGAAGATHKALLTYVKTGKLDNQQLLELLVPHKAPAAQNNGLLS